MGDATILILAISIISCSFLALFALLYWFVARPLIEQFRVVSNYLMYDRNSEAALMTNRQPFTNTVPAQRDSSAADKAQRHKDTLFWNAIASGEVSEEALRILGEKESLVI